MEKTEEDQTRGPTASVREQGPTSRHTVFSDQKLDKYINFIPSIAFDATLQASWEAVAVSFQAGLLNGGPTSLVWGMLLCWIGTTAMAASIAEMASINPTVGAQYRWTSLYAPPVLSPKFWGLLQGWITVFAWIATCAQVAFLEGTIIQGLVIQNNPDYTPKLWHGTLLTWAVLLLPILCNLFARRILPTLEIIGALGHIVFFFVIVITLAALAPPSTASFVFTETITGISGWSSPGIQWCIGLLSSAFPLGSFDGIIHMSAEVKDAEKRVPQSMVTSVVINGGLSFAMIITLLFTIGDLEAVSTTPTGYPIIAILFQATKSNAATTVLMTLIVAIGIVALFGTLASVSRLVWAFARDGGIPFGRVFTHIHPALRVPLNAVALVITVVVLLTLITVGNTTAFFAILSLNTLALYLSYLMPILFFTLAKLRGDHIPYGPFRLGRFGLAVNFFAIVYAIFIIIFLPFPPIMPVTGKNMNYAGPIMGAVIVFAIADYMAGGRKRFRATVQRADVEATDVEETNGLVSGL